MDRGGEVPVVATEVAYGDRMPGAEMELLAPGGEMRNMDIDVTDAAGEAAASEPKNRGDTQNMDADVPETAGEAVDGVEAETADVGGMCGDDHPTADGDELMGD
eukprot:3106377-Amphidinium_carterae.1